MKIELIPAIDIIGGQCVRLTKGDYDQKTVYGEPLDMALEFERIGFKRLHVVDLDGAKSKHIVNENVLKAITSATSLTMDFGGGIKTDEDIEKAFAAGAAMVTVGSVAVTNPDLFMGWLEKFGAERMILGADVRHGNSPGPPSNSIRILWTLTRNCTSLPRAVCRRKKISRASTQRAFPPLSSARPSMKGGST